MKTFFTLTNIVFFGLFSFNISQASSSIKVQSSVEFVDPYKFSGLWYEIARTYNSFEKDCVAATVEYKLIDTLTYDVTNRCFKNKIGNELILYNGVAKSLDGKSMKNIEKTYYWIFSKDYQIIYLDDYKTAVMSDKDFENLWIMNREPFLKKEKLNSIIQMLSKYMDTSKLIFTPQDENGRYK